MLTERLASRVGVAAVIVMGGLLVLVGFRLVPPSWEIPLFAAAVVLFAARLVLRAILARRRRSAEQPAAPPPAPH
jgi:hypothetical protein